MCCCLLALGPRSSWGTNSGCVQTLSCPFPQGQWIKGEILESFVLSAAPGLAVPQPWQGLSPVPHSVRPHGRAQEGPGAAGQSPEGAPG